MIKQTLIAAAFTLASFAANAQQPPVFFDNSILYAAQLNQGFNASIWLGGITVQGDCSGTTVGNGPGAALLTLTCNRSGNGSGGTSTGTGLTPIAPGTILANTGTVAGTPTGVTFTSYLDTEIGNTVGSILQRTNSGWGQTPVSTFNGTNGVFGLDNLGNPFIFTLTNITPTIGSATGNLAVTSANITAALGYTPSTGQHFAGASNQLIATCGAIHAVSTPVTAGTSVTNAALDSYALPPTAFNTNNQTVLVRYAGTTLNNADSKAVGLQFGSTAIPVAYTTGNTNWSVDAAIFRTGSNTQTVDMRVRTGSTMTESFTNTTATDTASITISLIATTGATASDVVMNVGQIQYCGTSGT